jgi:hypothetical protein
LIGGKNTPYGLNGEYRNDILHIIQTGKQEFVESISSHYSNNSNQDDIYEVYKHLSYRDDREDISTYVILHDKYIHMVHKHNEEYDMNEKMLSMVQFDNGEDYVRPEPSAPPSELEFQENSDSEKKIGKIFKMDECFICRDALPTILLVPCGHVVCSGCVHKIDNICHFCRQKISVMMDISPVVDFPEHKGIPI